jgi:hypothetical protein
MELKLFLDAFSETATVESGSMDPSTLARVDSDFIYCIEQLGGKSYCGGLYRLFSGDRIGEASEAIQRVFPEFRGKITVFGYDWLGRHFAVDNRRIENGQPLVLMLEVGAGEAMQIPTPIIEFHNTELVEYADDALARQFFEKWKSFHPSPIGHDRCAGYKIPLFLGGRDTVDNLELIDLSVYVEICGQLRNQIKKLPAGQTIRDIAIK